MPLHSLRWRLAGLVAVAVLAAATVLGVLVHRASHERELTQARAAALTTLDRAAVSYTRTGTVSGTGAVLDAPRVPRGLSALVRAGHSGTQYAAGPGGPAMWAARPADGRTLSVRFDMGTTMRDLAALDASILVAGLLTTALVLPLGALTAGRMSRRLRTAAGTARQIAAGDLDARIAARPRPHDEIAEISGAVDSMASSLQARLRNEQRFTADVAHELRTPLTGLATAAELLPEGEMEGYVRGRVRALVKLIEDLLEISRLDAGAEHADLDGCSLVPLIEGTVRKAGLETTVRVEREAAVAGPPREETDRDRGGNEEQKRNRGPAPDTAGPGATGGATRGHGAAAGETRVWTDPRRLERIVANLLLNAHRHGRPPVTVTIGTREHRGPRTVSVSVRDRGPGFPADLLDDGPQRFRTGARERGGGHGLGLTIALGQAQVIGAVLEFGNAAEGGALATIRLPEAPPAPLPPPEEPPPD